MKHEEPELWIVVTNWDRFQHYSDRNPPWIKNYTRLLHDHNYLRLTGNRRALLHALWLEYALSERCVPLDVHLISRWTGLNVKMRDLESLNDAGFIEFVASKPLAPRARSQETEKEKDLALRQELKILPADFGALSVGRQAGFQHAESEDEPWPN